MVAGDRGPLRLVRPDAEQREREAEPATGPLDLDTIFRRHARYVGAIAYRLLGRDDEVDDVVQEVFLEAIGGLARLADPGALKGWLRTITVRVVARRLRARTMRRFFGLDRGADYETIASRSADPETRTLFAKVYASLDALPAQDRIAWTLRHVEGDSLEEVAAHCGCSLATAKRRIAAAHERLTKELNRHG